MAANPDSPVLYDVDDHIAVITANRPRYRNAQSRVLLEALDEAFKTAADDPDVRVIVLKGAGEHFSAGHDLGTPEEMADRDRRPLQEGVRGRFDHSREQFVEKSMRWRNVQKPTLAAVQGYCIFGGWIVASAMDIIFAADDAMFLASNFQFFTVPWDVHPRKAKEILYQGRFIDAQEALQLDLVNRVVPVDELEDVVMQYARDVAKNDPFQLRMTKLAVNQMQDSQGFGAHMTAAHLMHMMSALGESDPDFALSRPDGKRRPMVQRALENYQAARSNGKPS